MTRAIAWCGWAMAFALMAVLSAVGVLHSRGASQREQRVADTLSSGLRQLDRRLAISQTKASSMFHGLQESMDEMLAALRDLAAQNVKVEVVEPPSEDEDALVVEAPDDEDGDLPELPAGVQPKYAIQKELAELIRDAKLNPDGKTLSRVEIARARAELARARGRIETLKSENRVDVASGMEDLRTRGEFVEYREGERYDNVDRVVTAGEQMPDGGVRMFYYYPEEFPRIYERKQAIQEIESTTVRRILTFFR